MGNQLAINDGLPLERMYNKYPLMLDCQVTLTLVIVYSMVKLPKALAQVVALTKSDCHIPIVAIGLCHHFDNT